jgi:hypothetical protein
MKNLLFVTAISLVLAGCGNKAGTTMNGDDDDDDVGSDGGNPPPAKVPLIVGTGSGLQVWADSASITSDVDPDVTVKGDVANGVTAIAISGDRLYVGRKGMAVPPGSDGGSAILAYDGAHTLTASATAAAIVKTPLDSDELRVDTADNLWDDVTAGQEVFRYASASTLAATAGPAATFTHPNMQLPSFAVETTSQRLFAGQISGTGVIAWNDAMTATGSPPDDFTLSLGAYWGMRVDHDRLYAVGQHLSSGTGPAVESGVAIWANASAITGTATPIIIKTGYQGGGFIQNLALRDDILVVVARDQKAIMIYKHASALSADVAPDFTITDHLSAPGRAVIDASHRLYIADTGGVLVFDTIDTAPTFVTQLATAATGTVETTRPIDLVLAE